MAAEGDRNEQHLLDEAAGGMLPEDLEGWADAPEFIPANLRNEVLGEELEETLPFSEDDHEQFRQRTRRFYNSLSEGYFRPSPTDPVFLTPEWVCRTSLYEGMDLAAAIASSAEKSCGVCFEVVFEKPDRERRFGILPQCNHCYCLTCIRKWRSATQFSHKIVRACPSCRVKSDFVCPSLYWVDTPDEKARLIRNYKKVLSTKPCKYFKQGNGSCPFGNKCFYQHALSNGTVIDLGPPRRRRQSRLARCFNRHEGHTALVQVLRMIFLGFLSTQDNDWLRSLEIDLDHIAGVFSESDESEWSDMDYMVD